MTDPLLEELLEEDCGDGVTRLTLNRPDARNALSMTLMTALQTAVERLAATDACRVIVLRGAGPAFCAGHDLRELQDLQQDEAALQRIFDACGAMMLAIIDCPKPVIAQVHGVATAAGCQLVATCDLAQAAADARFATPGVNIGLFCSTPMVALSRNIPHKQAMRMLLTGEMIDAVTAESWGLVSGISADAATLATETLELARNIADKSPLTVGIGKAAFQRQRDMDTRSAYRHCAAVMTRNMLTEDAREGIDAMLNRRSPQWQGR